MNNVILIGRLTRDPELRYAQSGMALTRFGLAVDRPFAKKEDPNAVTADFFNVTIFGKRAETCAQYLAKGRLTAVRGRIQNENYTDKDGIKRYSVSIIADDVQFLEWSDKGQRPQSQTYQRNDTDIASDDVFMPEEGLDSEGYRALSDDDVPF